MMIMMKMIIRFFFFGISVMRITEENVLTELKIILSERVCFMYAKYNFLLFLLILG